MRRRDARRVPIPYAKHVIRDPGDLTGAPNVTTALRARAWMQRAACRDVSKRPIFVQDQATERHSPASVVACFAYWRECPVRRECLQDALGEDAIEVVGVWCGTMMLERRQARYLIGSRGKVCGRTASSDWLARSAAASSSSSTY